MLAIHMVTDIEILDCTGRTQSPCEARPAPVAGWKPNPDSGRPKYSGSRHWYAVRRKMLIISYSFFAQIAVNAQ
ncbi:hypothetical protein CF204P1_00860 [Citrobacter freundii]|nr:hypothetical protein CF204P1_00860 [Citrobacter freundii]